MIGLLIKDLFAVKRQLRIVVLITVIYFAVSVYSNNLGMFTGVAMIYSIMLPITSMAEDEQCKWDRYAVALPLSRATIVLSKYVMAVLLNIVISLVVGAVLVLVAPYGSGAYGEVLPLVCSVSAGGMAVIAVLLPLLYKYGVEKARLIMIIVFLIPFLLIVVSSSFESEAPLAWLQEYVYLLPAAALGLVLLSFLISIRIYRGKEF